METNDYKVLLVVASLGHYTLFGFAMKLTAWRKFLGGHQCAIDDCAIKFDQKKTDLDAYISGIPPSQLKQRKFYIVRIRGNKTEQSPNKIEEQMGQDGLLFTTPSQLTRIGIKTQSFRIIAEPFIWNYMVENDLEGKDSVGFLKTMQRTRIQLVFLLTHN